MKSVVEILSYTTNNNTNMHLYSVLQRIMTQGLCKLIHAISVGSTDINATALCFATINVTIFWNISRIG